MMTVADLRELLEDLPEDLQLAVKGAPVESAALDWVGHMAELWFEAKES